MTTFGYVSVGSPPFSMVSHTAVTGISGMGILTNICKTGKKFLLTKSEMNISCKTSVSLQKNIVFVFVFKMFQCPMEPQSCCTQSTFGTPGYAR